MQTKEFVAALENLIKSKLFWLQNTYDAAAFIADELFSRAVDELKLDLKKENHFLSNTLESETTLNRDQRHLRRNHDDSSFEPLDSFYD